MIMIMTDVILFLNSANGQLLLHVSYTGVAIVKNHIIVQEYLFNNSLKLFPSVTALCTFFKHYLTHTI